MRAITNKVRDDIQRGLRDAQPAIRQEGEAAGKAFSDGFGKGSQSNLGSSFEDSLRRANLGAIGERGGHDLGAGAVRGAEDEIQSGGRRLERAASTSMQRAGRGGGDGFLRGFLSSGFAKAAEDASKKFTLLFGAGNLLGPAISGLVSLLGSATAGLLAMAGAAAQAAGALAVVPGSISVLAQGLGVLKLAFSGVGGAVSAGFKQADTAVKASTASAVSNTRAIADARTALARAHQAAAQAIIDADQRVADAAQSLARTRQDAAQALADATRSVGDAERDVADAQRATLAAQQALNAAREEGIRQLRDLAFEAEDAGLAEEQAGLDLIEARRRFEEAQALPPDDTARQQAELSFRKAELAFREAKARNQDLQAEEKKAAKEGVKGTDAVIAAREKINDAVKNQSDAEESLADARRERHQTEIDNVQSINDAEDALSEARQARAQTAIDNAQSIADAQLRLNRALQDQASAAGQASSAADAYTTALNKLSPAAQAFVRHLVAMRSAFDEVKAAAGEELFPKLTVALDLIANNLLPNIEDEFRTTGGIIGEVGLQFARTIATGEGLRNVQDILAGNNRIMKVFTERTETGRSTVGNFAIVLTRLLKVVQPLTRRFAQWIRDLSVAAENATDTGKETGKLTDKLDHAGDVAAQLGDIFKNIGRALAILFDGSKKSGQGLLDSFEQATKRLDKFLEKARDDGSLQQFFRRAAFNLRKLGDLFNEVFKQLTRLSNSKAGGNFAESLIPVIKNIGDIAVSFRDASPRLGKFLEELTGIFESLTQTGQIDTFIDTLTRIAHVIRVILGNPFVQFLLKVVGGAVAMHRAFALALIPLRFFFLALVGGPITVLKSFQKMRTGVVGIVGKMGTFFKTFKSDGLAAAFKGLGKSSDDAKQKLREQMTVDEQKTEILRLLQLQAERTAGSLEVLQAAAAPAVGEAEAAVGAAAVPGQAGALQTGESAVAPALGGAGAAAEKEAATVGKSVASVEKSGGRMAKAFGGIGKALGGVLGMFLPFSVGLEGAGAAIGAAIVPILAVVAAVAAFVGMFILLYKQSPQFKKFIDGIVGKIKDLVHWFKEEALPVIQDFAKWIAEKFIALVVPPIDAFFKIVNEALPKIGEAFEVAFHAIVVVWNTVLHPVLKAIIAIVKFLWKFIIKPYLKLIQLEFKIIFALIKFYWEHVLKPVVKAIIEIIKFLWKNIVQPYLKLIQLEFKIVFTAIKLLWNNVLKPVFEAIKNAVTSLLEKFRDVFGKIKDIWKSFIDGLRNAKDTIGTIVENIGKVFDGLGKIIKNAFKEAYQFLGRGVNNIIGAINKYLIGGLNKIGGKFGIEIGEIPKIPGLAKGGRVRGQGGERQDNLPHMLSNNEFVIQASSAKKIGYDKLEKANKTGDLSFGGLSIPHPHIPGFDTIKDLVGDTINGVENVGEKIAKVGLGKVLEALVKGAESLMVKGGLSRGSYFNDLVYGVMDQLASAVKEWGGDAGEGVTDTANQSLSNIKSSGKWKFPIAGPWYYNGNYPYGERVTSTYYHTGSDFPAKVGTPLIAMGKGIVRGVTNLGDTSYGRYVTIDYGAFQTLYAHMNAFQAGLHAGMAVKGGTRIGQVGWYGNVQPKSPAGAHLHLEASTIGKFGSMSSTIDPIALLRKLGFAFAKGGVVSPTDGGMLGIIGEAGKHERIEPLDREGFSKRDRAILDMIRELLERDGNGDTIVVNPSRGMDERELASLVARRMQFRRRTGV